MPGRDLIYQVYTNNPTTYNYGSFLATANKGGIKYIVVPKDNPDINQAQKDLLFLHLDPKKFQLIHKNVENFMIFEYQP